MRLIAGADAACIYISSGWLVSLVYRMDLCFCVYARACGVDIPECIYICTQNTYVFIHGIHTYMNRIYLRLIYICVMAIRSCERRLF